MPVADPASTRVVAIAGRRAPAAAAAIVFTAGATAAVLDLVLAWLVYVAILGVTTIPRVLQSIAAGVLGRSAFQGGVPTMALGATLHLLIGCTWAAIFHVAHERSAVVRQSVASTRGAVLCGLAYGVAVWAGMRFIVVPLSRAGSGPLVTWANAMVLVGHTVLVGLPIVLVVRGMTGGAVRRRT